MEQTKETFEFKTEVQQVLNLIINSLYSNKNIFLRELVSNASDAIDKLRFKAQTEPDLLAPETEFKIKIIPDGIKQTLEIVDNGIGMTYEEVQENIGTIAKSGTAGFLEAIAAAQQEKSLTPELIGQFGVGFYSAFMVAEKVTLLTRAAGQERAVRWESHGDGTYTIEETTRPTHGTQVILQLKKRDKDEPDYTDEWIIRDIIRQHSDFVSYPITMDVERNDPIPENEQLKDKDGKPIGETTRKVVREETLNSMKAIWAKDKKDITDQEYEEFYKHISRDWNAPLERLHLKFEGTTEYSALLYIPSQAPFDLFNPEKKHGVRLYCKRVFIMDNCQELMPDYLRFVKGVVDAPDLNLNISREILQQDHLVRNIRRNLIKKIFELFENMPAEKYEKFYAEFGQVLKIGVHIDPENRTRIAKLLRFKTTKSDGKWVSLTDYVTNMKAEQEHIYYITGDNLSTLLNSPHLESLRDRDIEVLLMVDPVDEWVMQSLNDFDGKSFKSAEKGDLDIAAVDEKKKDEYSALFGYIKGQLEAHVKEVKGSARLKDSVACLSGDAYDLSAYMEKILKATGQAPPEVKRVLELNLDHPLLAKIKAIFEKDRKDDTLKGYSQLLFDLAVIAEGGKLENPSRFSKIVGEMMADVLPD